MNRRSFLSSCLALAAAPAIVRADSLMRIVPRDVVVIEPGIGFYGHMAETAGAGLVVSLNEIIAMLDAQGIILPGLAND